MYIATTRFLDGGHEYREGDIFPYNGAEIDKRRLKAMATPTSKRPALIKSTGEEATAKNE